MSQPAFFSWRKAILKSDLQPTTRHVLLTLACHMNDAGESCFPSIKLLCEETGLSNRAVITHLQKATEIGWIIVGKHGFAGQRWAAHEYRPAWPYSLREAADSLEKAVNDVHNLKKKAVNEIHHLPTKAVNVVPEGGERGSKKAVNDVHTSTSMSTSMSTSEKHNAAAAAVVLPFDEGVFPEIANRRLVKDWIKIRKAKRLPITETGLDGFVKEVRKSGLDLEDALRICCENGWAGFRAGWINSVPKQCGEFEVTESMHDWAVDHGVAEDRIRPETEKFYLQHKAKGSEFVDWVAAWKSWMVSAASYGAARK